MSTINKVMPEIDSAFFNGSYGGDNKKISHSSKLECKICWYVYDPKIGDEYWQIPAGTPFSQLPEHWGCPECDGKKDDFLVIDT
jgi:rubredoxin